MMIVPTESAYPGYGSKVVLEDQDHITVCKLSDRDALGYATVKQVIGRVMERTQAENRGRFQA
jgi:hypothetical protein